MEKFNENNQVEVKGEIVSDFKFSHEIYGESFYIVEVAVKRLSDFVDHLPVLISERLIDITKNFRGQFIIVNGEFRSFNMPNEGKSKLILTVFAKEINFVDVDEIEDYDANTIIINGYLCKEPIYRKTPKGREIADILVAVNRAYGKSDYIPCICWGRTARYISVFGPGDRVKLTGRIQSREYFKRLNDEEVESRIAYEVSVGTLEIVC